MSQAPADLLIVNAKTALTLDGPAGPRSGKAMSELGAISGGG